MSSSRNGALPDAGQKGLTIRRCESIVRFVASLLMGDYQSTGRWIVSGLSDGMTPSTGKGI